MNTVSFAARRHPVVLETPLGGVAMTVIWPPFVKLVLPHDRQGDRVAGRVIIRQEGDRMFTVIRFFFTRLVVVNVTS